MRRKIEANLSSSIARIVVRKLPNSDGQEQSPFPTHRSRSSQAAEIQKASLLSYEIAEIRTNHTQITSPRTSIARSSRNWP